MNKIIAFLALCTLSSCIKPFDVDVNEGEKALIVNGLITNEPGPYTVRINKTTSYGGYYSDVDPSVKDAVLTITDDNGHAETLKQVKDGEFITSATGIQGQVGRTYTLHIHLKNGQEYVSQPEKLQAAPALDRLYFEAKASSYTDKDKNIQQNPYFELRIDMKDKAGEKNFYRWTSIGTYEVETQPELHTITDQRGNLIPDPKDCCWQCWLTRTDYSVRVNSDRQFDGHTLVGQTVATIPITPQFMGIKYHVELKQYAISEQAFEFWSILQNQSSGTGSVQDPAPANARGNISNTANPDEFVLGYFGASGVSKKTIFIKHEDVPFPLDKYEFHDDCRVLSGATTTRPSFWQ